MLQLIVIEDKITCTPDNQDRNHTEVLVEQIENKYLNKIILNAGLAVAFFDFVQVGDPYLYPGEGASVQLVRFRLVVFRPLVGEILAGRVISSNRDGLKVSMGFFDDISIPSAFLQEPSEYNPSTGLWKWNYEGDADFVLKAGDDVRFKVRTITFTGITSSAKGITATTTSESNVAPLLKSNDAINVSKAAGAEGSGTAPLVRRRSSSMDISAEDDLPVPMQIVGSMNDYGLGSPAWW